MSIDYKKYSAEQIEELKQSFIANECESDEYRETQPFKGMAFINEAVQLLQQEVPKFLSERNRGETKEENVVRDAEWQPKINRCYERATELIKSMTPWIEKITGHGYDGSEELIKIFEEVFDIFVESNEHPYFDQKELDEWIEDMKE